MTAHPAAPVDTVAALPLDDKVRLLTGATPWRLHPLPAAGLRPLVFSDGPAGVRGTGEIPGWTTAALPSPTALAATWDEDALRRAGRILAAEARAAGVDVLLAPLVNLQRTPVAGRHFEYFSEDPLLTARLSAALVTSLQSGGVAACAKHFVANDSETDRTSYTARVDERTLREVYLAPFEYVVREAGVWTVMSAYSGIDDGVESSPAGSHHRLLTGVLKDEWGFDGIVVSDWAATTTAVAPALGGLDLAMPGPDSPWSRDLADAVRSGAVPETVVDDKVRRLLRLADRVGALGAPGEQGAAQGRFTAYALGSRTADPAPRAAGPARAAGYADGLRELAASAMVVLRRPAAGALPVAAPADVRRIALIGPNAVSAFAQGGGSAFVEPPYVVGFDEGLRAAFPDARLTLEQGADAGRRLPAVDPAVLCGAPLVELLDGTGAVLGTLPLASWEGTVRDFGPYAASAETLRLSAELRLTEPGEHLVEVGVVGRHRVEVDGTLVSSSDEEADGTASVLNSSTNLPDGTAHAVQVGDVPRTARVVAELQRLRSAEFGDMFRGVLRHGPPAPGRERLLSAALDAARDADLVVVVVGTTEEVESEGWDRTSLALPGDQDALVEAVLSVAPDAVVVVNAGAPVQLPWLRRASTVLWSWFPGQEAGHALADVLTGRTEPAGRLPWTLPDADPLVPSVLPDAGGVLAYTEGLHPGYRGWLRSGREPAAPFGHGLGWTDWAYGGASWEHAEDGTVTVAVDVTNSGARHGSEVVQVYLSAPSGGPERPARWLAGFARVSAGTGATVRAEVRLARRAFEVWNPATAGWEVPPGAYTAHVGRSVADVRRTLTVPVGGR
ncbi:glycoside hydrolase family 3 C-terminal domain-containing protein [Streptomyces sp. NPDC008150]|uniref:beta-glucosidase family protein n=1 Tax=Streptomyces sp. NPDC008150 TaxID=3364816 RepID=UPI0036F06E68